MESDDVRGIITMEVQNQLKPFKELLDANTKMTHAIDQRLKSLWGNGTGPPGYLETAREEDKRRNDKVDRQHELLLKRVDDLSDQIVSEGGVQKGIDKADSRHSQTVTLWVGIGGIIISFGLLIFAALMFWAAIRVKSGDLIIPHFHSQIQEPEYTANEYPPQDAGNLYLPDATGR